jgi:hydrogenase large subunit
MLEDVNIIAEYYGDYFSKGISYPNLLSYGLFDFEDTDISYVRPKVMIEGIAGDLIPKI